MSWWDVVSGIADGITDTISDVLDEGSRTVDNIVQGTSEIIDDILGQSSQETLEAVKDTDAVISSSLQGGTQVIQDAGISLEAELTQAITTTAKDIQQTEEAVNNEVSKVSQDQLRKVYDIADELSKASKEIEPPNPPGDITQVIESIPVLSDIAEGLSGVGKGFLEALYSGIEFVSSKVQARLELEGLSPTNWIYGKLTEQYPQSIQLFENMGIKLQKESPLHLLGMAVLIGPFLSSVSAPVSSWFRQQIWPLMPTELPNPTDLITMQVREVWDPKYRDQLIGNKDISEFKKYMLLHGYTEDWANSYWAAHWRIPSTQQGFEMFHRLRRGRVDPAIEFLKSDLTDLLERNDVLSAYIPRLTEIAYSPITRVDIRRLRQQKLISEKEVEERYRDIGYSPSDAHLLASFTESLVSEDLSGLAKSDVLSAYKDDVISREQAKQYLKDLSYADSLAEILLSIVDKRISKQAAKDAQDSRKLTRDTIEKLWKKGLLTLDETEALFLEHGVAPVAARAFLVVEDEEKFFKDWDSREAARRKSGVQGEGPNPFITAQK